MKVLHAVFSFHPDQPGGTELYVEALAEALAAVGVESVVAAPASGDARYHHHGIDVRRFAVQPGGLDIEALYGDGDPHAAQSFARVLDEVRPDVLHQHALTPACSAQLMALARQRGIPVVFTYHTPTTTCQRGSLLEWGRRPCDGRVSVNRCTPCTLHGLGLDSTSSSVIARTPGAAGELLARAGLGGGAWTALRMRSLMRRRVDHLTKVLSGADRFVALAPWVDRLLQVNGVPAEKIISCAHGAFSRPPMLRPAFRPSNRDPLRVVHLGRLDPVKGTHVLIDALRALPDARITLDILGIMQGPGDASRLAALQGLAAADGRIRFLPQIPHAEVVAKLSTYDLVAVPSQWFETGPLVVLEAFAAGVPVLGSALGGIADKVRHSVDGWLVTPHDSVTAWSEAFSRLAVDGYLMTRLRTGVRPPRTMADVAKDMKAAYLSLRLDRARPAGTAARALLTLVPHAARRGTLE